MSMFLTYESTFQRLKSEWIKHGGLIVAYDVDSTVLPYHREDSITNYLSIHQLLRELKQEGCTLVVFTAANESRYATIQQELVRNNVPYDYFNVSPPFVPDVNSTVKVYANIYLDDRAGLFATLPLLKQLLMEMKGGKQ